MTSPNHEQDESSLSAFIKDTRSPLAKLLGDGPTPTHKVFIPRGRLKDAKMALRSLPSQELLDAGAAATQYLLKVGWKDEQLVYTPGSEILILETRVQQLFRALVDPDRPERKLAASVDELRALLEPDEIVMLYEQLLEFQQERSPFAKIETWAEVEGLIEALGKGWAEPTVLNSYDAVTLRYILHELAVQHSKLTKQLSLDTLSPSDSESSLSEETES